MAHDAEIFFLDFSKEEVIEALIEYAVNRGVKVPGPIECASLQGLGRRFREQGYHSRLAFSLPAKETTP